MPATHTIEVGTPGAVSYFVEVGQGLLDRAETFLPAAASSIALICDDQVGALYGDKVEGALARSGAPVARIEFPAGEASKTRHVKERIEDAMSDAGLDRRSVVVALGGGVTSDLAGFAAATFMRGIATVNLPTSLLAMVDATVGGKTGVDTPAGKNLVGAFHSPLAVAVDVACLRTLDREQMLNGLAEMIKHAVIADPELLCRIEKLDSGLTASSFDHWIFLVAQSIRVKAQVVSEDPLEAGYRQVLNFGHTVGHAFELLSRWTLGHGRAVALGMAAETEIAHRLHLLGEMPRDRIQSVLGRFGLLRSPPPPVLQALRGGIGAFVQALNRDKKNREGRVRMALPQDIGAMAGSDAGWTVEVSPELVIQVISDLWLSR